MPIKLPKGCTQSRYDEIQEWTYKLWDIHWGIVIKGSAPVSNSRASLLKYTIRDHDILTPELMKKIELAVLAYTKYLGQKRKAGDKLIGIKTLSVWYNQSCYEDQFIEESAASLEERTPKIGTCCIEGCNKLCHGPQYQHCTDHIPDTGIDRLRANYRDNLKGMIHGDSPLTEQCKAIFAKHLTNVQKDLAHEL